MDGQCIYSVLWNVLRYLVGYRKVAFILRELGLTYEGIFLDADKNEHKAPEYVKYNPNGRIPTLIDHKAGDFVIW